MELQSFKHRTGDLALNGDLPGVAYGANSGKGYRIVAINDRGDLSYTSEVRNTTKTAQDRPI